MDKARKYIVSLLMQAFDIRPGEYRKAMLMQLNIFLIISTLLIVKPAVNGMFLAKFGAENLPNAYVLVAIIAGLVSFFYSKILSRIALNIIITRTLSWSVISLLVFGILLHFNFLAGWVLYLFYIWVAIFAVLSASQFWVLANIVFNPREAKRLFGFIGAGAIAGGIFGGYLTSLIADLVGSESLLFVAAFVLFFSIPITKKIWKNEVLPTQTRFERKKRTTVFDVNPMALIRKSKHLTYLALIIGISVLVAKLVDYQFSAIASAKINDPDDLTAFFGFWFSSFNLISLGVQLFITRKVVGVFGVGTSLFFLPFGIMLGAFLVLIFPELWAVIILKLIDGSLKQSVNKSATELMSLPIPLEIRNQTKSFIDVFVDSAATGVGGLILIFLVTGLNLSTRFISLMILALFFVWIYYARKIRLEYIRSFKSKIDQEKDHQERKVALDFTNESVISGLSKVLQQGSEKQIIFVLDKIKEMSHPRLFDDVQRLLTYQSAVIRAEALRCLYFFRSQSINDLVLPMIQDSNQQVKSAAFEYLIAHSPDDRVALLRQYLGDRDFQVRGAALVSLAVETHNNPDLALQFDLEERLGKKIQTLARLKDADEIKYGKIIILKSIAQAKLTRYYPVIDQFLKDENIDVVRQAIAAAGQTLSPDYISKIAGFLNQEQFKENARDALIHYGPAIIEHFSAIITEQSWSTSLLLHIPALAAKIGTQPSVDLLFSLLDHSDIGMRMEALRALNTLKINHANLRFHHKEVIRRILDEAHLYLETLRALYTQNEANNIGQKSDETAQNQKQTEARKSLIVLLERRLDGMLERIFRLLGLKYPPDDILTIYQGLQSKKPDMRINAVEFLDNLLEQNLKRVLVPIVETAMLDNISATTIKNLNLEITSEFQCLSMLLAGKDLRITLAALYLIAQLDNKKYLPLVKQYAAHSNPKIRQFAQAAIDKLSALRAG